jgi:monothiol glutaredoxin
MTTTTAQDQIRETVQSNDVVLFMKGTKQMPQCGFSSRVAGVLNYMGVEFRDVNVLADAEIRQGSRTSRLAHDPAALRQGRVRGRLRHRHRDDDLGRARRASRAEGIAYDKAKGRGDPGGERLRRVPPKLLAGLQHARWPRGRAALR